MLNDLRLRLKNQNINVNFTSDLKKFIIDNSYSPSYGARPIKRFIQKNVETVLAKAIITSEIEPYANYVVDYIDDIRITKER